MWFYNPFARSIKNSTCLQGWRAKSARFRFEKMRFSEDVSSETLALFWKCRMSRVSGPWGISAETCCVQLSLVWSRLVLYARYQNSYASREMWNFWIFYPIHHVHVHWQGCTCPHFWKSELLFFQTLLAAMSLHKRLKHHRLHCRKH